MKNLLIRTVTGVFFVAAIVICFCNAIAMAFLFAIITGLTVWEFAGLIDKCKGLNINRFISTVAAVYLFLAILCYCSSVTPSSIFVPYLITIVYLFVSGLYLPHDDVPSGLAYAMFCQFYIALPLSMLGVLAFRSTPDGVVFSGFLPLSIFIMLWLNDTGAYCFGSLFGKHKLFLRISPAKTWEGSVAGGILVLVASTIIWRLSLIYDDDNLRLTLLQWMGLGIVVALFGTWGDLVESLIKRSFGVKDSGSLLPGHGGMLDRFDSALLALPASVIYLYALTFI